MVPRPCALVEFAQHAGDEAAMNKGRLEAFSDGVIAIIITIMVLELKVPHGDDLAALQPLLPVFLSYVLSFVYVGIYWNNHHHMLHADAARQRRRCCGPTCICCSGCRWCRSSPAGWARTISRRMPVGALRRRAADGAIAYTILVRCLIACTALIRSWPAPSVATARATSRSPSMPAPSPLRSRASGSRLVSTSRGQRCGSFPIAVSRKR